jgi:RNA polymerase sigma factor (sigma-70 family)
LAPVGEAVEERAAEATPESRRRAAVGLIEGHDRVLRGTARRYSLCADDADDAYQRALEIMLTKSPPIDGEQLVRWMQTVTKREALAVRRQRERLLSVAPRGEGGDRDPLERMPSDGPEPTDRAERRERVTRSGEALRTLKPQEVRTLMLKAEGYSYVEIGEITGFSYTKINRCLAEGRKRFLKVFAEIEEGRRCESFVGALSAFADGEIEIGEDEDLKVHLRSCVSCRADLRAFRAVPQQVLGLMPVGPVLDLSLGGRAHEWLAERGSDAADRVREVGYSIMSRGADTAGDTGTQLAAAGGTRGAGLAAVGKLLAICGATAAGSAACVATGVVDPDAIGLGGGDDPAAIEQPAEPTSEEVPVGEPAAPAPDPAQEVKAQEPVDAPAPQQTQFGFEASNPSGDGGSSSGGSDGSVPEGGGGSGGGGSGGAREGFGF